VPRLDRPDGALHYDVCSLVPPWEPDPPAILFHHGVGINSDVWAEWLPMLADRFRLVRFDMRGFGRSAIPGPGFRWSLELLAEDALAVAEAAGARRFHVVGESLGGTVALFLAIHHPDRLASLTVCSASHRGASIQRVREWRDLVAREGMTAWSAMMMARRFAEGAASDALLAWFHREQSKSSADATLDLADMLIATDLTPGLSGIRTPTLLLAPDSSPFVPLEIVLDAHGRIPRSEVRIFAGVQHGLVASHGAQCARAVREFIERRRLA
jgi:pimeloyl-ACP methyl ester carboxylesterase